MEAQKPKLKLAVYWAAACGGCCVSVLDVHEKLYDVVAAADLVFWPIALDIKYSDVEAMPDGHIDVTLFNGAIRNSENEHMAKLLRRKTKVLIAYGSCSHLGGIPGLANFSTKESLLKRVYEETESTVNVEKTRPQTEYQVPEGILTLPDMYNDVRALKEVVSVDYFLPGCPPQTERLVEVFMAVVTGAELPPAGSVVGAGNQALCETCERKKTENKNIKKFYRSWEVDDDGVSCFMEQGILCLGPTTRTGCGNRCIVGNAPCRSCYGPLSDVIDPGTKMMSAISSIIDSQDANEIEKIVDDIADPAGTFYRYSLPSSIIRRKLI
jgi:F420-non-reducing hydrogenase small subunit